MRPADGSQSRVATPPAATASSAAPHARRHQEQAGHFRLGPPLLRLHHARFDELEPIEETVIAAWSRMVAEGRSIRSFTRLVISADLRRADIAGRWVSTR